MIISNQDILIPFYNNRKLPRNFIISDQNYFCPNKKFVFEELFPKYWSWLNVLKLAKWEHKWDCDNFADAFKLFSCGYYSQNIESDAEGIGIGVINYMANIRAEDKSAGGHAINIIYIQNESQSDQIDNFDIIFFEPQNGSELKITEQEFDSIWTVYI
jgi:hypothetical protein